MIIQRQRGYSGFTAEEPFNTSYSFLHIATQCTSKGQGTA